MMTYTQRIKAMRAAGERGYLVMCRVTGGVTGTREAVLKANGQEQIFITREEAEAEAVRCTQESSRNPYATAYARYWVVEEGAR